MNIIICDDSQNDRKILIELLQSYAQEKKQCFEMIEYDSGASLCEDESALQKDDDAVHHYLSAVGYDDFQHGRYGDPNGKDTSDQRTWELAYHVEGAIRATD